MALFLQRIKHVEAERAKKQSDEALHESEERFHLMADTTPMLMWMSGTDKLCTYFNKAWLDFSGRSKESELGNGWAERVHPEDLEKRLELYRRSFDRREEFRTEYRLRRHDAEYRWVLDVGVPRFNPDHSFAGYIGSCIDVTDRKRVESERAVLREELAHLNRVASMGQMAASLAHELAQPLAAILSNAQAAATFAARSQPNLEEVRGALTDIIEDDQRAHAFVNNMRSMFQKQMITPTPLDLNRIAYDVSRLVRNDALRKGVRIRVVTQPAAVLVTGDAIALQQVLLNLVNNGMDALQHQPSEQKEIILTTLIRDRSDYGSILVEDNGCGIAEEDKSKLFTPFFTTKKDGLGMGLSICRSLIESLGGEIRLLDSRESGTVFQVNLHLIPKGPSARKGESKLCRIK
jgi:PAS domain S-box-containing protein